ncbi:hypothetical protein LTR28_002321, partial [Elasticomyces elasticus]
MPPTSTSSITSTLSPSQQPYSLSSSTSAPFPSLFSSSAVSRQRTTQTPTRPANPSSTTGTSPSTSQPSQQASTSLTIWGSFFTWLPVYVVTHFEYVKSLESAHNAALVPILVQFLFTVGLAARKFLFQASSGAAMSRADAAEKVFAPDTVSLLETLRYNAGMWRWTKREDVLAKRTAVLTLWTFANTWVRVFGTLDGSDALGAAGWAG